MTIHPHLPSESHEVIDSIIKKDFDKVIQEIFKDLDKRKLELDTKKAVVHKTLYESDRTTDLAQKMLQNLKNSRSDKLLISADDMLENLQARDVLKDEDYQSFEKILRETFDEYAEHYWNEQIGSCMSAINKVQMA